METAVRRRAAAIGEIQPDLSRRLYSVCCHHSLEILGLWARPTDFSVSGGDIFVRKPYGTSLKGKAEKEKQSYSLDRHSLFCGSRNFLDDLVLFLHISDISKYPSPLDYTSCISFIIDFLIKLLLCYYYTSDTASADYRPPFFRPGSTE